MSEGRISFLEGPFAAVANRLFSIGAVKLKGPDNPDGFRLKLHETQPDAPNSPFYLNLRSADNPKPGPLAEREYDMIAQMLLVLIAPRGVFYEAICGLPNAGDPIAEALARELARQQLPTRVVYLQKEDLPDGNRRIVAGDEDLTGLTVLVVDDLITRAGSKREGIAALESMGATVTDVLVLVDREQGGAAELEEAGYELHAALRVTDLFQHYRRLRLITPAVHDEALAYLMA